VSSGEVWPAKLRLAEVGPHEIGPPEIDAVEAHIFSGILLSPIVPGGYSLPEDLEVFWMGKLA
jgi:hypothetical protein